MEQESFHNRVGVVWVIWYRRLFEFVFISGNPFSLIQSQQTARVIHYHFANFLLFHTGGKQNPDEQLHPFAGRDIDHRA